MVVTKDATIAVASAHVPLITIGYFLICFCSGFAAETHDKGNTRRQQRNKFVLDEQQCTLKDHLLHRIRAPRRMKRAGIILFTAGCIHGQLIYKQTKKDFICHSYASHKN